MFSPLLFPRAKLDLGIVKKSIVVDDVSKKYSTTDTVIKKNVWVFFNCIPVNICAVVHLEGHSVWTGSFPTGVVGLVAKQWSTGAGLSSNIPASLPHFSPLSVFVESSTLRYLLQIIQKNQSVTSKTADPPSSAILVVYLDKAEALPVSQISLPSVLRFVPA